MRHHDLVWCPCGDLRNNHAPGPLLRTIQLRRGPDKHGKALLGGFRGLSAGRRRGDTFVARGYRTLVRQKNGTRGPDLAPRFASGAEGLAGMKKRLFMHIGLPKTGTTAIQTFCREHRSVLEDHDLYYPAPLPGLHGHSDICPTRKPLLGKDDDIDANMEKRVSSILSSSCRRALISEEALLQSTPSELRVFFDTFDVCVIAYLRSPMLLEHSALLYEGFSYMLDSKSPLGVSPLGRRRRESGAPIRSRAAYGALCENWLTSPTFLRRTCP